MAKYELDDQALSLKLFVVLSKAHKVLMEISAKDIRRHGLSLTEFAVLELLYHKGEVPLQQIAGKILLTSGSITYVADKLEEKGFIQRKPCENDRRVTYAVITSKGQELFHSIFPDHANFIQSAMSSLSAQEKQTAIALIKQLGQDVQQRFS
ncbi:MarR family transcriptional regulator [Xylanibacillus composti]|uniref:MarR family transcriptional regulator n=1 Tax=Xylanibacillus composti TaxID=1572762 RepID=A0A8J4H4F6_9BACL|nr:MarR family transcriptional regulator [Xylanibacillus composti]MDT9726012.1 MarR family transcriptional regulator [Xylanibacillus composti]GIQ70832.1 MarR family transcriptional regulator [Xylanibacillus composti]